MAMSFDQKDDPVLIERENGSIAVYCKNAQ